MRAGRPVRHGGRGLARRIGQPPIVARDLLRAHRETYRTFWRWSDAAVDTAMLTGSLHTVFGWHVHVGENPNPRSLRNFPMQANGAEMLRLASCLATERGIEVCAPVHDAVLICAPLDRLDEDVATMRAAMAEASRIVLDGFELGTDVSITRWPDRYMDGRGRVMWDRVMGLLDQSEHEANRMTDADDPYADLKQHALDARDAGETGRRAAGKSRSGGSISSRCRGLGSSGSTGLLGKPTGWRCACSTCIGKVAASPSSSPTACWQIDGVSRQAKWRALNDLERRGLISVERRRRRSPLIRVLA